MKLTHTVEIPYYLKKFLANPTPQIENARKAADKEVLDLLKTKISAAAPKKSGKLSQSITVDLANRKVYSPLVYARAIELGHYARPINTPKKMFLHFTDGGKEVFLKYVRIKKQPYFFKTIDENMLKIRDIYEKAFEGITRK